MIYDVFPNAPLLNSYTPKTKDKEGDCVTSGCGCITVIISIIVCVYLARFISLNII